MAASIKISELPSALTLSSEDLILLSDLSDGDSRKVSLGALEGYYLNTLRATVDSLVALSGVATDATNMGNFSGDIVSDNMSLRDALPHLGAGV